ncbi:MAG: methyl-accepting chemotaxis protein [Roseburia sp.]
MNSSKNVFSTLERSNKTAMTAHLIDSLVMIIFCVLQALSQMVSWSYILIVIILGLGPVAASYLFWRKNHETRAIKHLSSIGFAVFYTFILFTATNQLVFAFVIPMVMMISIYNDTRASLLITIGIIIENFLVVILGASTGQFGYLGRDYGILQVTVIILVGIYLLLTTKTLRSNFSQVLSGLSSMSGEMKQGIEDIHAGLVKLDEASASTINAMQEVTAGTNDTAEAVQNQLLQTQEIQSKTALVSGSTDQITEDMQKALYVLEQGSRDVALLVEKVDTSVQNGVTVAGKLRLLEESVTEMNSIVESLSTIARQTGLLAINARIEASHAGTAGKGFAVVAAEISELAAQSREAASNIGGLITHAAAGINEVVAVIYQMIDGIQEEKSSTEQTAGSFASIQESTLSIRDNLDVLLGHINALENANRIIADSVQTISAVSEEVAAHAAETASAEDENAAILRQIDTRMQELLTVIEQH